jgi:hypothetical protein
MMSTLLASLLSDRLSQMHQGRIVASRSHLVHMYLGFLLVLGAFLSCNLHTAPFRKSRLFLD